MMLKFYYALMLVWSLVFTLNVSTVQAQSPLAFLQNGHLQYTPYANEGQTNAVNIIPDYSHAGYRGGGVAIPFIEAVDSISPVPGDMRAAIQAAIDRVSARTPNANGIRGALYFKPGIYLVDGTIFLRTSGVVLRGAGNGVDGSVLIATFRTQDPLLRVQGSGSGYGDVSASRVRITQNFVPSGTRTFEVEAGHTFQPGQPVIIRKTPNDDWINLLDMAQYGWTASGYRITHERTITAVEGNNITIDIPLTDPIEQRYGGSEIYRYNIAGRISECGVEDLRMESVFENDTDENHSWQAIALSRVENSWVRNIVTKYFANHGVNVSTQCRFITVQDCAMIDPKSISTGGRKYPFNLEANATSILFQRCMAWGGRHCYVSGSRVPGPNVFLDCVAENTLSDIGPHHRWSTGQLYDNIYGGQMRVQNRGASGSGHGWVGAQIMFWNCRSVRADVKVESPAAAKNFGIGVIGQTQTGAGYWESWGAHVQPRSLYLQQLQDRLGAQAVTNVTTASQRANTLRDELRARIVAIQAEEPLFDPSTGNVNLTGFDITDNGGVITAEFSASRDTENFPNVIDNNVQTKYFQTGRTALWIQYQSTEPAVVVRYTLTSANDQPTRDPRNWLLLASNDGVIWDTLDRRTDVVFNSRFETRSFDIENNLKFHVFFRLQILQNNGNTGTQLAEWELFQRKSQSISFTPPAGITFGIDPVKLEATSSAQLPVEFSVVSGPAQLEDNNFLAVNGAGAVSIRLHQAGSPLFLPKTDTVLLNVGKATQLIAFAALPPQRVGDSVALSTLVNSSSGLPVEVSVMTGTAQIRNGFLIFTDPGMVMIRAVQLGNDNFLAAEAAQVTIQVEGGDESGEEIRFAVVLSPNPGTGQLKVMVQDRFIPAVCVVRVYNLSGQIIQEKQIRENRAGNQFDFDLTGVPSGVYLIHVKNGNRQSTQKWVKTN